MSEVKAESRGRRVAKGAGWLYGYRWVERILDALAIVVLARLLSPDDFGLVAIASSFVAIVEGLAAFDVNKALIRTRDEHRALYDTAWTLSALRGLLSALCMLGATLFLNDERLITVVYVLALSPVLNGLANPRFVMFERDLVYSKLALLTLGAKTISFGVTLAFAWVYGNYWALVFGVLAGSLVSLVLSYVLRPFQPRFTLARFKEIFGFSGWLSLTTVVTTLSMETDKLIVGRLLGIAEAGLYFMTQRVGVLPTRELVSPLQRILFPSFSELVEDRPKLRRIACESINVLGSLSLPAGFGFALVANDVVPLVFGAQWTAIVPLLVILVPYLGVRATLSMALPCVMALGKTRLLFWVSLVYACVHVPVFIAGTAWYGLEGAIWSIVLAGCFYIYLNGWLLRQVLGISWWEILGQLWRPLIAASGMVGGILALGALWPAFFWTGASWWALVIKAAAGSLIFGALQLGLWWLAGRPAGFERRLLQVLGSRFRGSIVGTG